jgi:hypothetical protein
MKNTTTAEIPARDIFDGDLKLRPPRDRTRNWHLAPNGNPHFYENFPRFYNGPARYQLRKPFKNIPKIELTCTTGGTMEPNRQKADYHFNKRPSDSNAIEHSNITSGKLSHEYFGLFRRQCSPGLTIKHHPSGI